ncbi:hypothetical protein A606_10325 [Corynebacterium terpenotabidum Y-11]|uniref:Uncharacterized protein n=1 Tax=Corynebacterium terpenotabidum Y-11 TaxID=1200352 RepID=S4XGJ3_9CORY|nr:hypothetical protein A606_10325 [Corynebacterium terpenotabidum Y-11]
MTDLPARASVMTSFYRISALFLGVAWPLWLVLLAARIGVDGITGDWYTTTTFLLFLLAEVLVLAAAAVGHPGFLVFALRFCGAVLVIALLLLIIDPGAVNAQGPLGLWFAGMTGAPAVAVAVTVSRPVAGGFFLVTLGSAALIDTLAAGHRDAVDIIANVGFALVNSFFFVAVATTMRQVIYVVDANRTATDQARQQAEKLRVRRVDLDARTRRFHTEVLDALGQVARGVRPTPVDADAGPDRSTSSPGPVPSAAAPAGASLHHVTGFNRVFSWPYLLVLAVVLGARMWSRVGADAAGIVTWVLLCGALALLCTRTWGAPRRRRAALVATMLCTAVVVGLWQGTGHHVMHWEYNAAALVAALLVTCGRQKEAMVGLAAGIGLIAVIRQLDLSPDRHITGADMAVSSLIVIVALLLRLIVEYFVRQLPEAQEECRQAGRELEDAAAQVTAREDRLELLASMADPVLDAAARVPEISPALARRADLTRLQFNDMVTTPRLAVPALREAVWDARARGVTVELVDEGEAADVAVGAGSGTADDLTDRLGDFLRTVDSAGPGSVVMLRLPPRQPPG